MTSPKTHAERMAALLERYDRYPIDAAREAMAYADSLAAQLEDERAKVESLEKERDEAHAKGRRSGYVATVGALHNAMPTWFREPDPDKVIPRVVETMKAAEEKLRAAERLAELARSIYVYGCHSDPRQNAGKMLRCVDSADFDAMKEALAAFDTINPDGSTGGAGEESST